MFHHTNSVLTKINEEERSFYQSLFEFKMKFEQITNEYSNLVTKGENLLTSYKQMASTFDLEYHEELCFGYKNLGNLMHILKEELTGINEFLKQPTFEFVNLYNEQTSALLQFIDRNQNLKSDIYGIKSQIKKDKMEKKQTILEDIERVCSYLNYVMHHHFKSFYLLKSKEMLGRIGKEIESHYNRLGTVMS